jgi:hypothetical protein
MAFAQLSHRESLRDIEISLNSQGEKLYHMGLRGRIARSTLADANETRDFRIYRNFAYSLIHLATELYQDEPLPVDIQHELYALDSTTIDLCLSLFPGEEGQVYFVSNQIFHVILLDLKCLPSNSAIAPRNRPG